MRGSTKLLQKSSIYLVPAIKVISDTEAPIWGIDANSYTLQNIGLLCDLGKRFREAYQDMSDTLLTKIMLGVFGNVPAFDINFRRACKAEKISATFNCKVLGQIGAFYQRNQSEIDECKIPTFVFDNGIPNGLIYTKAKVIDMAFFAEGEKLLEADAKLKADATQKMSNP